MDNTPEKGIVSSDDVIRFFEKEFYYKIINLRVESKRIIGLKIIIETENHLMLPRDESVLKNDQWKNNYSIL